MFDHRNIAVLDLTHAGMIIARKLCSLGFNVSAIDVYGTVDENILSDLESGYGIKTSKDPVAVDNFDLIVSPVHLDPAYPMLAGAKARNIEIMTHHQAVGLILSVSCSFTGARLIEITGSKAKTSSASLLARMLSLRMKVILHSSRGLELWVKGESALLNLGLSIAPGSILLALDRLDEMGVTADCYIFEVSLGLTGFADMGVITTLEPDYLIAASSFKASNAKADVLSYAMPGEIFFLNSRDKRAIDRAADNKRAYFTFTDSKEETADLQVYFNDGNLVLECMQEERSFISPLLTDYNYISYGTAFAVSSSVAMATGVSPEDVISVISSFQGLAGRMQEKELSGRKLIDNSNSGMDIRSAEKALDYALAGMKSSGGIIMILGEEAAQVCEGLPPVNVSEFISRRGNDIWKLILVGERMKAMVLENIIFAPGLKEGIDMAVRLSSEDDIILSCVKCFR